jgi:hypothetical protein
MTRRVLVDTLKTMIKTKRELCVAETKIRQAVSAVDGAISDILYFLEETQHGGASSGDELEQSMVDDLCQKEGERFGTASDDEGGVAVQDSAGNPAQGHAPDAG